MDSRGCGTSPGVDKSLNTVVAYFGGNGESSVFMYSDFCRHLVVNAPTLYFHMFIYRLQTCPNLCVGIFSDSSNQPDITPSSPTKSAKVSDTVYVESDGVLIAMIMPQKQTHHQRQMNAQKYFPPHLVKTLYLGKVRSAQLWFSAIEGHISLRERTRKTFVECHRKLTVAPQGRCFSKI